MDVNRQHPNHRDEVGAGMSRAYLDGCSGDPKMALAAYYQGATARHKHGIYKSSEAYVNGIWALRNRFQQQGA